MNYAGLKDDVLAMLSGDKIRVNVNTFQNDLTTVASKDDALTALIHLCIIESINNLDQQSSRRR